MSFGIGDTVEVITSTYLGRWIYPFEIGEVEARHFLPTGQEIYDVRLADGELYTFAPGEIEEVKICTVDGCSQIRAKGLSAGRRGKRLRNQNVLPAFWPG